MRSLVTFLSFVLLGAIAAFLLSNNTPIALTFLGITSLALPLSLWMAAALLVGVATGLWFLILFRLAERRAVKQERARQGGNFGPDDFAVVNDGFGAGEFAAASAYQEENAPGGDYRDQYYGDRYDDREYTQNDNPGYARNDGRNDYQNRNDYPNNDAPPLDAPRYGKRWSEEASESSGPFSGPREAEFEMVEAEPPVYDANYRVIQPPEPEDRYQGDKHRSDSTDYNSTDYGSTGYSSTDYGNAETYQSNNYQSDSYPSDSDKPGGDGKKRDAAPSSNSMGQTSSQQKSQQKSQPEDDWDIENDLDW